MHLTLKFEFDHPIEEDTTRRISATNRDAADVDIIITRWKEAYEKQTGEQPHVVLAETESDVSFHPSNIDAIDEIRG